MTVTAIIYLIVNQIKPTLLDHQGKNEIGILEKGYILEH